MRRQYISTLLLAMALEASCSPYGAYRELRSDRHRPSASDLAGTWRVTPESAADAAATGLPRSEVGSGFITFKTDGTCTADLYDLPCGHFPTKHEKPSDACAWSIASADKPIIMLTFGKGRESWSTEVHRLETDPPLLWQYICDPDWARYLEFRREPTR